jgi:cell wall assembly regulator SMI1
MLVHGFTDRPKVARALVELVPEQAVFAVQDLSRFLDNVKNDPSARSALYAEREPGDRERLCTVLALATLNSSYAKAAAQAYNVAKSRAMRSGAEVGAVGPAQPEVGTGPLLESSAAARYGQIATVSVRALLRQEEFEVALSALQQLTDRGVFPVNVVRPLSGTDPRVRPALIDSALRALAAYPDDMQHLDLPGDRASGRDAVSEILECGPAYRDRLTKTLRRLVDSAEQTAGVRRRAAARLRAVAAHEYEAAMTALAEAEVYDPEAPLVRRPAPTEQEFASVYRTVAAAWQRIEREIARRPLGFPVTLGGAATRTEIAACEDALGLTLPAEFAASLLLHRSVAVEDTGVGMVPHKDLADLPEYREFLGGEWTSDKPDPAGALFRTDYGWRDGWVPLSPDEHDSGVVLDLDPAPAGRYGQLLWMDHGMPEGVSASGWLEILERFATNLEQDR